MNKMTTDKELKMFVLSCEYRDKCNKIILEELTKEIRIYIENQDMVNSSYPEERIINLEDFDKRFPIKKGDE